MNDLTLTTELTGLPESKAQQIKEVFEPMVKMLESFESAYAELMEQEQSEEKSKKAKRLRLDISRVRIEADKVRKAQKEEYLRAGNAIQGVYNVLKFAVVDKEEKLKEVEEYYERIESEKIAKIHAERTEELAKYEADSTGLDLGKMPDEVWKNFLAGAKSNYENLKAAERKAEEERLETERKEKVYQARRNDFAKYAQFGAFDLFDRDSTEDEMAVLLGKMKNAEADYNAEQAEIKSENERLRKEAEEKEKARLAAEEKARKENEKREAELKVEREERARIEREQREREEKAAREAEEKRNAELAPDKDKLLGYAKELLDGKDRVKSDEAKKALAQAVEILTAAANKM